jgi:hypothetical protein
MNTIEQPQAPRARGPAAPGPGRRAAAADVVPLLVTILGLLGAAAGIAIGFPRALEAVATHANASIASPAELPGSHRAAPEEETEIEDPLILDDVRSGERMYAAAPAAALPVDDSAPQPSGTHH